MKIKIYYAIFCLCMPYLMNAFSYDSAIYNAQKGDIKMADEQMRTIIVNSPDSPDVLYDAGVLAYQLNNFNQAEAYFSRAAQCAHDDKDLCFRAHFNAGNASVDNKNLKSALNHYEEALRIDSENEYARHNRDRVAQMLKEQEKQEQQKNKEDHKDQNEDKKDQNDENEQQRGDQNDQEQSDNENNQQQDDGNDQQKNGQGNQKENNGSQNKSDQKSQDEQADERDSSKADGESEKGKEQEGKDNQQHQNSTNDQRNSQQGFEQKPEEKRNDGKDDQLQQHQKSHEKQDKSGKKSNIPADDKQEQDEQAMGGSSTAQQAEEQGDKLSDLNDKINDPWLLSVLSDQELHDKAVNKKLMEARIRQHGGKNGQNCW